MKTFLIIIGIFLLVVFVWSFYENSKREKPTDALKSGLWSAGGCFIFIIVIIFLVAQCAETFNSDSSTNRKLRDIERGDYDPYD